MTLTEYEHRDFSLVDVLQAGCSKGAALSAWAADQGIPASDVMAVGDNLNDLEMLEFAGTAGRHGQRHHRAQDARLGVHRVERRGGRRAGD